MTETGDPLDSNTLRDGLVRIGEVAIAKRDDAATHSRPGGRRATGTRKRSPRKPGFAIRRKTTRCSGVVPALSRFSEGTESSCVE
jgi:hypothetical protein